jgi:phosphatidylserine decarboxylase
MPEPTSLVDRLLPALITPSITGITNAATVSALELLSAPAFSQFVGKLAQAKVPRPLLLAVIQRYIKAFNVDTSEINDALESFATFDDFFTRALRPGIHVVDPAAGVAVSPVDARVGSFGAVSDGLIEQVKGRDYRVEELLDSAEDARRYARGGFITLYLSPRDYHRIHSPVDGDITGYRYVPGRLYPVNRLGLEHVDRLFAVNERLVTFIDTKAFGEVAVVKVGATNVGMITASYHAIRTNDGRRTAYDERFRRKIPIARAGELGRFHLGSTVVLLWSSPTAKLVPTERGHFFRMGQRLLTAN